MKRRYTQVKDGEWFAPSMKDHRMVCCDCGLTHAVNYKVVKVGRKLQVMIQPTRDRRVTAALRRSGKFL